jgi:hypothetical protein
LRNSPHSSQLYGFFRELQRRNVYRVAAGYGIVGWLLIQFAVAVFPILSFPGWATRFVVIVILAGFPIAPAVDWLRDDPAFQKTLTEDESKS